jgi:hypothetical protein
MNPFSQPVLAELKLLSHRVKPPRRRVICGKLLAVLKMKLGEAPGIKTVLKPEIFGKTLMGLNRC